MDGVDDEKPTPCTLLDLLHAVLDKEVALLEITGFLIHEMTLALLELCLVDEAVG